ncbi:hypothetical protein QCA50_001762 [Cerrena zonata]|uniref:F-box/LRR-repeat protein 15/At3g58940/PEG3-like LRR domain-containing protein n=1 Tax=Cerrena zonata TaxID=2478898 RepID=A0AAW0GXT9_9APHY
MAPKRKAKQKSETPAKRRKITIGAKTTDDDRLLTPQTQSNTPSSSAWSTRVIPARHIPPLATLCMRVFAENLHVLAQNHQSFDSIRAWLKALPDSVVPRLFASLRSTCPTILSHAFIVAHLLRGTSIVLTGELPGVNKHTVFAIGDSPSRQHLRELVLSNLDKITDDTMAPTIAKLPSLQILVLRGCTKVGSKTTGSIAKNCPHLKKLNLNYTSVTPSSIAPILRSCSELEVIKLGGIPNWTDATVAKLWTALDFDNAPQFLLPKITSLNLRQMPLSDTTINQILAICPNIRRLNLSFTHLRHPPLLLGIKTLEKLSVTSTSITSTDLLAVLSDIPNLKSLSIGALGGGQGSSVAISNSSAMTLTDHALRKLTDTLAPYKQLENVSLVGNTKLGIISGRNSALAEFIRRVGRRCTRLNLAAISSLRSSDLEGLLADTPEEGTSRLKTLVLNNTSIDDSACPFISSCRELETLELASTKVTNAGVFVILDACPNLTQLNLTSCRGIGVVDRRHFFKIWETEWKNR